MNRGKDKAADFFPISQFRSLYYRPDVIALMLHTLDEGEALRLANVEVGVALTQRLPPVVTTLPL